MAEEIHETNLLVFNQRYFPVLHAGAHLLQPYNRRTYLKRRLTLRSCSRIAATRLPGADLAVEYVYGKYIRNLSTSTIEQSGRIVYYFLQFLERKGTTIHSLTRQDISGFVEYEQDRGLKTQSVVNHLRVIYTFIAFLVDQGVLPNTIMERKIRIKLPQALPRAISPEDLEQLLGAIRSDRDRALILLLLRTGMRIGELLEVLVSDISFRERKIMIYLGEKNFQGRAVYYSQDAEQALTKWLKIRSSDSTYLFPGRSEQSSISYVAAWQAMRKILAR